MRINLTEARIRQLKPAGAGKRVELRDAIVPGLIVRLAIVKNLDQFNDPLACRPSSPPPWRTSPLPVWISCACRPQCSAALCTLRSNASGLSEAGSAGAPGSVINAINDAMRPLGGQPLTDMPFTPEKILGALGKV